MSIKKMFFVVVSMLVMLTGTCFAKVTLQDLNIGGVTLEQPLVKVVEKYGKPTDTQVVPPKGVNFVFIFDDVVMELHSYNSNLESAVVNRITVDGLQNRNLIMSSGIGLGSTIDDVLNIYGKPDSIEDTEYCLLSKYYLTKKLEYHPAKVIKYNTTEGQSLAFYFINNKACAITIGKPTAMVK